MGLSGIFRAGILKTNVIKGVGLRIVRPSNGERKVIAANFISFFVDCLGYAEFVDNRVNYVLKIMAISTKIVITF